MEVWIFLGWHKNVQAAGELQKVGNASRGSRDPRIDPRTWLRDTHPSIEHLLIFLFI